MKPELIINDFQGVHNSTLDKTSARLMKGGSWKKQRVIVLIPSADSIPAKVVLSWLNLGYPPNNGVVRILAVGMEVGDAYSSAIEGVLANKDLAEWEYLLTIEHDNAPPSDGVLKLVETLEEHKELSAVSGAYFTKGEGGVLQAWGDPKDPILNYRPQPPVAEGLVECCGLGMGFCLFRLKMFKDSRLRKPWFKTLAGSNGFMTQDLYFWQDARKYGYRCAVDCRVKVGHYDAAQDIMW